MRGNGGEFEKLGPWFSGEFSGEPVASLDLGKNPGSYFLTWQALPELADNMAIGQGCAPFTPLPEEEGTGVRAVCPSRRVMY